MPSSQGFCEDLVNDVHGMLTLGLAHSACKVLSICDHGDMQEALQLIELLEIMPQNG